ncbi:MAG TPA: hypothetical protein VK716_12510 [Terracidiphilus sp.]|jgi:hypothetical protein|nr:hypothetical protein [Terracidiphilus sp.]
MPSIRSCLYCASVVILSGLVAISPAETTPTKQTPRTSRRTAKETAPAETRIEVINGTTTRTQVFQDQAATPSAQTKVEVINGNAHRTQVFEADSAAKAPVRQGKMVTFKGVNGGPAMKVMVINGTRWETRNFVSAAAPANSVPVSRPRNEPVVVGIESSANRRSSAHAAPVVVGIESSGSRNVDGGPMVLQVAASGTDGGKMVTPGVVSGVSPAQPKRPPYRRPGEQVQ